MTREYIIKTCEKYNIKNYTINDDLSIDVSGDVNLYNKGLTELPLVFNIVDGDFWCNNNKLTNLKGSPRKCDEFYCYDNELTSLKGAPDECISFSCHSNYFLNTLKGAPKGASINANYGRLDLDIEELYIIEALISFNNISNCHDEELERYYIIRYRDEFINSILN